MRVALHSGTLSDGNAVRGVGAYTKFLYESLKGLERESNSTIELVSGAEINKSSIKGQFDIIHYPFFHFFYNTLPLTSVLPRVVTIHDTIPLIYPKQYPPGVKGSIRYALQKLSIKNTAGIITDSNTSKKDIVRFLPVQPSKVYPIYLGPTVNDVKIVDPKVLKKYELPKDYVLYVGDINWNKNVPLLAQVCTSLKKHLVIVGKMAASHDYDRAHIENQSLRELQDRYENSEYVHITGFVSDEDISHLFKSATLLCQPSHYEGFGLSVLDAMNLGIPTICAKTQALVEIYESGSVFFDPLSAESLAHTIKSVIESKKVQEELILKGSKLAARFSWEKTARETFEVYKLIAK